MSRARGYAYIEILVAMALVIVSLAPMLESLANGIDHQSRRGELSALHDRAQSRLQTLQAEPFAALEAAALAAGSATVATAYSDPLGVEPRLLVYLARYDLDNADGDNNALTGGDDGLVWMQVASEWGDVTYLALQTDL